VGGWHWQERDVLAWAQQDLAERLAGVNVGSGFSTGDSVSVSGEATLNTRKGKTIPAYELAVRGTWTGDGGAGGDWEIPYLADEDAGDPSALSLRATVPPGGDDKAATAFAGAAKGVLAPRVAAFVAALLAGGPGGDAGEGAPPAPKQAPAATLAPAAEPAPKPAPAPRSPGATTTVSLTEEFHCRPADVWDALTHPGRVQAFTRAPSTIECRPGGAYKLFGGAVDAAFAEVDAPNRMALSWRFRDWPEGATSRVVLTLAEPSAGRTVATMTQTGVPTTDRLGNGGVTASCEAGWRDQIFGRLRAVFGYGC